MWFHVTLSVLARPRCTSSLTQVSSRPAASTPMEAIFSDCSSWLCAWRNSAFSARSARLFCVTYSGRARESAALAWRVLMSLKKMM